MLCSGLVELHTVNHESSFRGNYLSSSLYRSVGCVSGTPDYESVSTYQSEICKGYNNTPDETRTHERAQ